MTSREVVTRCAWIAAIVAAVDVVAVAMGRRLEFVLPPSVALAGWLALLLVIRPYVYERFDRRTADWIVVILLVGPFAVLAAPFLWWEHRNLEPTA